MFLPDDPLAPHTTYRATGVWNGTDGTGPDQTIQWEFTTGAGHDDERGGATTTTTTTITGTTTRPGGSGLRVGIAPMRVPRLGVFARRGLTVPLTCTPACRATVTLTAKIGGRRTTLGKSKPAGPSTSPSVRIRPAAKLRRRIRRLRRLTVRIQVSASAGGATAALGHRITLRR
jgi:hypothetical protein